MARPLTEAQAIKRFRKGRVKAGIGMLRLALVLHDDVCDELARPDSLFDGRVGNEVAGTVLAALGLYVAFLDRAAKERDG
jgi:hypothetical protein